MSKKDTKDTEKGGGRNEKSINHRVLSLDVLRGVAISLVLLFHALPRFAPSGYLGVDCFFVLAGFLAANSLLKRNSSLKETMRYPVSRIRRLAPAALVTLTITAIGCTLLIPEPDSGIMWTMHREALGLRYDEYLTRTGNDYFGQAEGFNPYLHFWTISSEIKYYGLIFLTFLVPAFAAKHFKNLNKYASPATITTISVATLLSFYSFLNSSSYYLFSSRAWQFGVGSLLGFSSWLIFSHRAVNTLQPTKNKHLLIIKSILFLSALSLIFLSLRVITIFPVKPLHVLATLLTILFIGAALLINRAKPQKPGEKPAFLMAWIAGLGVISYSVYLIHWPLIVFTKWTWGDDGLAESLIVVLLSILAGFALHKYIESKSFSLLTIGALSLITSYATLPSELSIRYHKKFPNLYLGANQFLADDLGGHGYNDSKLENKIAGRCNQFSRLSAGDTTEMQYFGKCHVEFKGNNNVFIFGDSSASVLRKELAKFSEKNQLGLSIHSIDACFLPDSSRSDNCGTSTTAYLNYLNTSAKKEDLVIISKNWSGLGGGTVDQLKIENAISNYVANLNPESIVFILGPYPIWNVQEPIRCFGNFGSIPKSCSQPRGSNNGNKYLETLNNITTSARDRTGRKIFSIDLYDALCEKDFCNVLDREKMRLLYKDDGHLTNYGAKKVIQAIEERYFKLIPLSSKTF